MTEEEMLQRDISGLIETIELDLQDLRRSLVKPARAIKHMAWCKTELQELRDRLAKLKQSK